MKNLLQYDRSKLSPSEEIYIADTVKRANKHGFSVQLINKKSVSYGDNAKVNGYMADEDGILATATAKSKKKWFYTFVHESCHMDQYIEDVQVWKDLTINGHADATDLLFMWLEGIIELTSQQFKDYAYRSAMLERDCEIRTAHKIVEYEFPYDVLEYIQRANAYVYFYLMLGKTRKWYEIGKEPYSVKGVWSQMPDHFNNDYTVLPRKYVKLYREFCY